MKGGWSNRPTDFGHGVEAFVRRTFERAAELTTTSVLDGLELTGAPGQPVIFGNLKGSFIPEFSDPLKFELATTGVGPDGEDVGYFQAIEDGGNDAAFFDPSRQQGSQTNPDERSSVGGYHSVKLTEASMDRIIDEAARMAANEL